jgi:hypothetical protein
MERVQQNEELKKKYSYEITFIENITENETRLCLYGIEIFNMNVYKTLLKIWENEKIRELWYKEVKYEIEDGIQEFFEDLKRFHPEIYFPTKNDFLLSRRKTIGLIGKKKFFFIY